MDEDRLRRYRENLAFYERQPWEGRARRSERRLTFNYAKAFCDKVTSYLLNGQSVQVDPGDGESAEARARARAAERALREVESVNGLAQLDFETELDCAVLGDAVYRVTCDPAEGQVRVSAPDVQGIYAWRLPDDPSRITAVASQYVVPATDGSTATTTITEHWTPEVFELWRGEEVAERMPNPYGFIPFVIFPNVREPKQAWGASDIPPLVGSSRELNRAFSQLSQILELSGNPIAVLEGINDSRDIAVEPGAVWEVPERARAYLLDLLQGGGGRAAHGLHRSHLPDAARPGRIAANGVRAEPPGAERGRAQHGTRPPGEEGGTEADHPDDRLRAPGDAHPTAAAPVQRA
ncbi:MAG TPA: phage portal protein, partial [Tepidiformaceae bacterium]